MPQEIMNIIWTAIGAIVTTLVGYAVTMFTSWIHNKIKDSKYANQLSFCIGVVGDVVKTTFQLYVEAMKDDGVFTPEEQRKVKDYAISEINNKLTPVAKEFIMGNFGDLQAWISDQIEVQIYNFKNRNK